MTDIFEQALQIVLSWEGGYGDHEKDPGGATNFGITRKTLRIWRGHSISRQDVRNLTRREAKEIYWENYWLLSHCNQLPDALAIAMFDGAVNQGVPRSKKLLQSALRVKVDGAIGPKTLKAVFLVEEEVLLRDFMAKRAMHYSGLRTLLTFGFGWFRRIFDVYGRALMYTKFMKNRLK